MLGVKERFATTKLPEIAVNCSPTWAMVKTPYILSCTPLLRIPHNPYIMLFIRRFDHGSHDNKSWSLHASCEARAPVLHCVSPSWPAGGFWGSAVPVSGCPRKRSDMSPGACSCYGQPPYVHSDCLSPKKPRRHVCTHEAPIMENTAGSYHLGSTESVFLFDGYASSMLIGREHSHRRSALRQELQPQSAALKSSWLTSGLGRHLGCL